MSRDPEIPPAGEEIHLPPGSIQPLLLTVGLTIALVGVTTYGRPFAAAVAQGNIMATQFHTEKSARAGLQVLKAFAELEVSVAR